MGRNLRRPRQSIQIVVGRRPAMCVAFGSRLESYDECPLVLSQRFCWDTRPGALRLLVNTQLFSRACPILDARRVSARAKLQRDSAGC